MTWESANPVAVVDEESNPPVVVIRYPTVSDAEWYLGYLHDHGGTYLREKIARGGYGIDAPEVQERQVNG
jgi:hypothetical protein